MLARKRVRSGNRVAGTFFGRWADGPRADFESINAFIAEHDVHPVIGSVFEFEQAAEAFGLMANDDYMGKIVIRIGSPGADVTIP